MSAADNRTIRGLQPIDWAYSNICHRTRRFNAKQCETSYDRWLLFFTITKLTLPIIIALTDKADWTDQRFLESVYISLAINWLTDILKTSKLTLKFLAADEGQKISDLFNKCLRTSLIFSKSSIARNLILTLFAEPFLSFAAFTTFIPLRNANYHSSCLSQLNSNVNSTYILNSTIGIDSTCILDSINLDPQNFAQNSIFFKDAISFWGNSLLSIISFFSGTLIRSSFSSICLFCIIVPLKQPISKLIKLFDPYDYLCVVGDSGAPGLTLIAMLGSSLVYLAFIPMCIIHLYALLVVSTILIPNQPLINVNGQYSACTTPYNGTCMMENYNSSNYQPNMYYYTRDTPLYIDSSNLTTLFHTGTNFFSISVFMLIASTLLICNTQRIIERAALWLPVTAATLLIANTLTLNPQEYDADIKFWSGLLVATGALLRFGLNLSLDRKLASLSRQHQVSCFPITHINKCLCPGSGVNRQIQRFLNPIREIDERERPAYDRTELTIGLPIYEDAAARVANSNGAAAGPSGVEIAINPIRQRAVEQIGDDVDVDVDVAPSSLSV